MKAVSMIHRQKGFSLIEVLVTLLILLLALLGLAGLVRQSQVAEMESYQRVQALTLLRDISARMSANRSNSDSYLTPTSAPLGTDSTISCSTPTSRADRDLCQWDQALKGAAETYEVSNNGESNSGVMIGGRGCITAISTTVPKSYLIEVVWQGFAPTVAPVSSVLCGQGDYGTDDALRRAVTTVVEIGDLG